MIKSSGRQIEWLIFKYLLDSSVGLEDFQDGSMDHDW